MTSDPKDPVSQMTFLIDGKTLWTELNEPYYFNDDGNSLDPWLFGVGIHELGITATASSGKTTATRSTVVAATVPTVPTALVGSFNLVSAGVSSSTPAGVWTLHVRPNGVIMFGGSPRIRRNRGVHCKA